MKTGISSAMDDMITHSSDEFRELAGQIAGARDVLVSLTADARPPLCGEHYLTGEEVTFVYRISKRTLQEYRDR